MSLSRIYTMWCDGCGTWHEGSQDCYAKRVRASVKVDGWKRKDNKDYCPRCAEKMSI